MVWLCGKYLQSYIRHPKWGRIRPVAPKESASLRRQSLQAVGRLPKELSAYFSARVNRLALMVDQSRRKSGGWREMSSSFW
jgi:hypothetical protein